MARTKRFIRIASVNAPYHPYWGGNGYFYGGYMLLDVPYYQREDGILPPSHYTFCAVRSPVDNHVLLLGEAITVMGLDQNDCDVQVDFIAGIWPAVNVSDPALDGLFAGNMENGYWTGIPGRGGVWHEYPHVDGGRDQGVTEELHYGHWLHSNCHKVPFGYYIPPAPHLGHIVIPPAIFGCSPDFHVNGRFGLYDCRAVDIPADDRYSPIPNGPVTLTLHARYDIVTGANIMVGGQPVEYEVAANFVVPPGIVSSSPVGGFPAGYLVAMDPAEPVGISYSLGVPLDTFSAQGVFIIPGGNNNPQTGEPLPENTQTPISDASRGSSIVATALVGETWDPVPTVDPERGAPIAISVPSDGRQLEVTGTGYGSNSFKINGVTVDQIDPARGPAAAFSPPAEGQTLTVYLDKDGYVTVLGVNQQVLDGTVQIYSLMDQPENPDVTVEQVTEDAPDPTETPSYGEMQGGLVGESGDPGPGLGDTTNGGNGGGGNWGGGDGNFDGDGGGNNGGNGTGGEGGNDDGGEGAE